MKLNQLSVIFIIIILPMSLVLSTYIGNLVDVSNQLSQYIALIWDIKRYKFSYEFDDNNFISITYDFKY